MATGPLSAEEVTFFSVTSPVSASAEAEKAMKTIPGDPLAARGAGQTPSCRRPLTRPPFIASAAAFLPLQTYCGAYYAHIRLGEASRQQVDTHHIEAAGNGFLSCDPNELVGKKISFSLKPERTGSYSWQRNGASEI